MNEKLIEYIKKHVEYGTDINKVKQALLSAGHDISVVEQHLNHVLKHRKLKEYIKRHVRIGSDIDKLKQYLLNAGYDINIVEEHINDALKSKKNRRYILITSVIVLLAIIISFIGFYYFPNLDKKTEPAINESKIAEIKYQKDLEIFNQALITNDTDICSKIEGDALKSECKRKFEADLNKTEERINFNETADKKIFNMALINHNESICLEIADTPLRNQCNQILIKKE